MERPKAKGLFHASYSEFEQKLSLIFLNLGGTKDVFRSARNAAAMSECFVNFSDELWS